MFESKRSWSVRYYRTVKVTKRPATCRIRSGHLSLTGRLQSGRIQTPLTTDDRPVSERNTVLFLLHSSQYSVCQSLWIFPVDSGIVDAGVQFVQVSKAAAQHSRGCMARRNVRYLVQTISNGAPWLSHFPRTLQAGINKLLSEDKPPLETSADLFQKSELLYSYRLDFRRVRSHFSLHARNHPVHQHVDWALLVPSSGGLLIANSFEITRSFGFFLDCWDEQCLDLSCWPDACSTTRRDWEKRCSSVAVLTCCSCWFLFFPFHDRAMTSEVRHERACTSFWTRVYCSKLSADREPEENEMYGHLRW